MEKNNLNLVVEKRDGSFDSFDGEKIYRAIMKAMTYGSNIIKESIARNISEEIYNKFQPNSIISIERDIEPEVYKMLVESGEVLTAKAYESYRSVRAYQRETNDIDGYVEGIVDGKNKKELEENSNKDGLLASTQRDLIAGGLSRDYTRRRLLPSNAMYAHDEGIIHFHDSDYFAERISNCMLVNLKDMLENGTGINKVMIETPKSFQTACTLATQIVQKVANGQYGGQTISVSHLAPYVRVSREKYYKRAIERLTSSSLNLSLSDVEKLADAEADSNLVNEIASGVQTIQYQVNTLDSANGQAPFLTVFMYVNEEPGYEKETAMIIAEMLKQRKQGVKNENGAYITPAFPKLIYVLDEDNINEGTPYYWLTELAAECVSRRMMPDFISAKIMKEQFDGEVFPCMGCRSFLTPWKDENGKYKWYGRWNQGVVTINLWDAGLSANEDIDAFWGILDRRLELCREALMIRHDRLKGTSTMVSPIHWVYGAASRLSKDDTIDSMLDNGYSTLSLGYAGLCECVESLIGVSNTDAEKGKPLALEIQKHLNDTAQKWKDETGIAFSLYGTPLESTTYAFASATKKRFKDRRPEILDMPDYITNSYHVNVQEKVNPFWKLDFESEFQSMSSGGAVSYVEASNLNHNIPAILDMMRFMYNHIRYAEFNIKSDYCGKCGFDGEMKLDENLDWYCPKCGNRNRKYLYVARRTCGYIGVNFWNKGRTEEIRDRYVHVDNHNEILPETDEPCIKGLRYAAIRSLDISNGEGIGTALFVQGCKNNCPDCCNPETHSLMGGKKFTQSVLNKFIEWNELYSEYNTRCTILGGEPLMEENVAGVAEVIRSIREAVPGKKIWVYTGFIYENLLKRSDENTSLKYILDNIDVLVDGRFVPELQDESYPYAGSTNQRVIRLK